MIGALVVYRIGTFIPVPGINPAQVAKFFSDQSNTIFGIVNMFSGGALSRLSVFAMGVMPYISASIIIQMMSMVVPSLMELRKEGESGRRKMTEYTRYGTVVLALFQSFAAAGALAKVEGTVIDLEALKKAGVIPVFAEKAKVVLSGKIEKAVTLKGIAATKGAQAAIEAAGGKLEA